MFSWKELHIEGDSQLYYTASMLRDGREYSLVAARQDEVGMCASATLSMKLIRHFTPGYLIMPGLAAGMLPHENRQMFGDVFVANAVYNYPYGKFVSSEKAQIRIGDIGFIPRPSSVTIDPECVEILKNAVACPDNECRVHLGTMVSGNAIISSSNISQLIHLIMPGKELAIGLDMEAYGVAYASNHAVEPRPHVVIAKSICDFADNEKDDKYQKFAAYTSCEFTKLLCEKILPDRNL